MPTPAIIDTQGLPTVVLIGRVNVGKSTLFNRLIEEKKAIVSSIPGTTRTRNEGTVIWRGERFRLVDTGGLTFDEDLPLEAEIIKQTRQALTEADAILFVTDGTSGVLPQEYQLAREIWKTTVPKLLVVNKVDNELIEQGLERTAFGRLNLGDPFCVSATNGRRLGDLLDEVFAMLKKQNQHPQPVPLEVEEMIKVSIIGKPNVGKSSLFNTLIGAERAVVSNIPHTTREPHDILVRYTEKRKDAETVFHINFMDTAGIRRKANVLNILEREGVKKSIQTIDASDIVLFVLDGSEPLSHQDRQLGGLLERHAKSVIILLNKWDLAEDKSDAHREEVRALIASHFPHLSSAPLLFVSGLTGYRVHDIFPLIIRVWHARHTSVSDKAVAAFLTEAKRIHLPSRGKGTRQPDIIAMKQLAVAPPVFEVVVKYRTSLHRSYLEYLEHRLRAQFDFTGTPIIMRVRKQKR